MSRTITLNSAELRAQAKAAQRRFATSKDANLVPPPTRAMVGTWVQPVWHVRDGANDHLQHASLPMGAQIQVRAV